MFLYFNIMHILIFFVNLYDRIFYSPKSKFPITILGAKKDDCAIKSNKKYQREYQSLWHPHVSMICWILYIDNLSYEKSLC